MDNSSLFQTRVIIALYYKTRAKLELNYWHNLWQYTFIFLIYFMLNYITFILYISIYFILWQYILYYIIIYTIVLYYIFYIYYYYYFMKKNNTIIIYMPTFYCYHYIIISVVVVVTIISISIFFFPFMQHYNAVWLNPLPSIWSLGILCMKPLATHEKNTLEGCSPLFLPLS